MSHTNRLLIVPLLCLATNALAYDFFVDGLYWRASEAVDWGYTNNLDPVDLQLDYQTVTFDYKPGFRIGFGIKPCDWGTQLYYTHYRTSTGNSMLGNVVPGLLLSSKFARPNAAYFYESGQINHSINFNMFDWDLNATFHPTHAITFKPIVGLKGGWIYQNIQGIYEGSPLSVVEKLKNNFAGLGPKVGIDTNWSLYQDNGIKVGIAADFAMAYLWGNWDIKDNLLTNSGVQQYTNIDARNMGAFSVQALLGLNLDIYCFRFMLGYEINDWMNQLQIYDDSTGAEMKDLVLQGFTLRFQYRR